MIYLLRQWWDCRKRGFGKGGVQFENERWLQYNRLSRRQLEMEGDLKLKNQLSYSPNHTTENVFTMRARIAKKPNPLNLKLTLDLNPDNQRLFSPNNHRLKGFRNKLFSGAHKITRQDTYLQTDKINRQSKTKGSSNPMSPSNAQTDITKPSPAPKLTHSRSKSNTHKNRRGSKDIQRTVSIAIKGRKQDLPAQDQLISTLTQIILGTDRPHDDFYLEILGESSIHGDEQNFIELDSFIFNDQQPTHP